MTKLTNAAALRLVRWKDRQQGFIYSWSVSTYRTPKTFECVAFFGQRFPFFGRPPGAFVLFVLWVASERLWGERSFLSHESRWPDRRKRCFAWLVGTAAEDRLSIRRDPLASFAAGNRPPSNRDL